MWGDAMIGKTKYLVLSLALLGTWINLGCSRERATHVTVGGGETPTFVLSGGGELGTFTVYLVPLSPEKMEKPIFDEPPVWSIVAQPDWLHGRPIKKIGKLMYGMAPSGYSQGHQPQPIIPGRTYFFDCETTDAPIARGFFRVENMKTVQVDANLPCLKTRDGKWVTTPCVQNHL